MYFGFLCSWKRAKTRVWKTNLWSYVEIWRSKFKLKYNKKKKPHEFAVDRPSFKFLNFFKKHYNLRYFRPQSNNFVIFDDYFIYNRKKDIREPFKFMVKSFEKKKQEDFLKDEENKKRRVLEKKRDNKVNESEPSILPSLIKKPDEEYIIY